MIIGFYTRKHAGDEQALEAVLKQHGAERVFCAGADTFDTTLATMLDFLRNGDVLVTPDLTHLGSSIEGVLANIERLHELDVQLHVIEGEIVPGSPLGDNFERACRAIRQAHRRMQAAEANGLRNGARGRPPAFSKAQLARAKEMLIDKQASVLEVARAMGVSPATVYRYFPRGRTAKRRAV